METFTWERLGHVDPPALREERTMVGPSAETVTFERALIFYLGPNHYPAGLYLPLGYDIEEKRVRIEIQGDPISIEADEQLLRQALFNLLMNAIQAIDAGGTIQIFPGTSDAAEGWIEIRDDGPGVPPERRQEVFKPYFTTQRQGTGLGLAVVQQIVLAHGWEISCLAHEPKGATFRIAHLKLASA